jgi:AcrR family transcriptional regulator
MFKNIERTWPFISILLTFVLLGSLFFLPSAARLLGLGVMLLGAGMGIALVVRRHVRAHRQGRIDRPTLARKIAVDVPGLILTMAASLVVGGGIGQGIGRLAGAAAEARWPGMGAVAGVLAGVVAGFRAGAAAGMPIRSLWQAAFRRRTPAGSPAAERGPAQGS